VKIRMLALTLLIILFLFYTFAGYYASTLVIGEHPEWRKFTAQPADFNLTAEVVSFDSTDGTPLKAWWLPAQATAVGNVVLAHGRDANRSRMLPYAALLIHHGYNVLALDLRNHGESGGNYITSGYAEAGDILAAVSYVRRRGERTRITVLGRSYGAVAALRAAADSPEIAAVISDSGFSSTETMMANTTRHLLRSRDIALWAKGLLLLSRCPGLYTAAAIVIYVRTGHYFGSETTTVLPVLARLHKPVLFISGDKDFIAPTEDARKMFDAAAARQKFLYVVPKAGHNETLSAASSDYERTVLDFLTKATSRSQTAFLPRP
jgi:pimeloyl-ACP methyl ester carboxylesterase